MEQLAQIAKANNLQLIISWANTSTSYTWLQNWSIENQIPFANWYPKVQQVQQHYPNIITDNQHVGKHYRTWVNRIIAEEFGREIISSVVDDKR